MEINDKLFEYLKSKFPEFTKTSKNGSFLFTCPGLYTKHVKIKGVIQGNPTATIISGTQKITCMQCGWRGTFFDAVRIIEEDKSKFSDEQITEYLINSFAVDIYTELDIYKKNNWSLVPIAKNGKHPIEKDWTNITHLDKMDWIKWLNNGYNIGLRTGEVSGVTVIDVDNKVLTSPEQIKLRDELIQDLNDLDTLMQNTAHSGVHYVFKYDKDIPQTVDIAGLKIDSRNDGGQILVQPSKLESLNYNWKKSDAEIKPLSDEVKAKLLALMKVEPGRKVEEPERISSSSDGLVELKNDGLDGCCNDTFIKAGGVFINKFSAADTVFILSYMNRNLLQNPMPQQAIQAMVGSLGKYKTADDCTQEAAIYSFMKMMNGDIMVNDVVRGCFQGDKNKEQIVYKYLSQFVKEGKAIRLGRGRYKIRERVEWTDKYSALGTALKYKVPYFDYLQDFEEGDIILLGAKPGHGKTTTSMNFIQRLVKQGIKPYYIYSESGSRYQKTAQKLGIEECQFYKGYHGNPLSIEIEPNAFTILDWLLVDEKEKTDTIFKFFTEEMSRKGGILVIMMQLKESGDWYAPNMVVQMPALAARYIMDAEDGSTGHWDINKLRDPKGNYRNSTIPCKYNFETKELTTTDGL